MWLFGDMKVILSILWVTLFAQPVCAAAQALAIHDQMLNIDTNTWRKSDGWTNGAPFQVGWRADHVDIYANTLRLSLDDVPCATNVASCSGAAYASGEYSSVMLLPYGQVDVYAQAASASGVITGLFLYTGASDGNPHDEIDIEFLGNQTNQVQFNYYVNGVGGHEVVLPLGFDAALAMHHYSIKWNKDYILWRVDGVEKYRVNAVSGVVLPSSHMRFFTNIWATKGADTWAGAFVYVKPMYAFVDRIDYEAFVATTPSLPQGSSPSSSATLPQDSNGQGGCLLQSYSFFLLGSILMLFGVLFRRKLK